MTKEQTRARNTIPLEALATRVARAVSNFLVEVRLSDSSLYCPQTEIEAGSPEAALPASGLEDRGHGWYHSKRCYPYRPHPSHKGKLATDSSAQSLHHLVISKRTVDAIGLTPSLRCQC